MTRLPLRQRGLTMAELLVAMALGLVVLLAGGRLLAMANGAYAAQVGQAEVDDGGRYALEMIGRALRQASFVDWERAGAAGIDPAAHPHLAGRDARSISTTSDGIDNPLPASVNGSDVLAVRFTGAGPAPDGDGSVVSCAGSPVHQLEDGWSIFYVAKNAQGEAELRCKYRGASSWGAAAVVGGVDSFQVLYGVDTDTPPDGAANRYVNAGAIDGLDAGLLLAGASAAEREQDRLRRTHWKRIVSVRVALLLHSATPVHGERGSQAWHLFGAPYTEVAGAGDPGVLFDEAEQGAALRKRERRLFESTVVLHSRPM
jgi:type IV pilus assembly protein PilW